MVDVETFSADLAIVTVRGVNIHPSIAKGRMVNALRAAGGCWIASHATRWLPNRAMGATVFCILT